MPDEHPLTGKTPEDLRKIGEAICSPRDWRWCAHWVCALHRRFRPHLPPRDYWAEWDGLLADEPEWHRGSALFHSIRETAPAATGDPTAEDIHRRMAEIGAKCLSNASWSPGLFDYHTPYSMPDLVMHLTRRLKLPEEERRMAYHFISLAWQSHPRPRPERGPSA